MAYMKRAIVPGQARPYTFFVIADFLDFHRPSLCFNLVSGSKIFLINFFCIVD